MIEPMLAENYDPSILSGEYYIQPKLDGHRAIWDGKKLYSRNGKEIKGVPQLVSILEIHFKGFPMDGELYAHGLSFDEITKCVRRTKNIQENTEIKYSAFDIPVKDLGFEKRLEILKSKIEAVSNNRVVLVETLHSEECGDPDKYIDDGYEGAMFRTVDGLYKFGKRSNDLLKYKKMHDMEAEVIDVVQLVEHEKVIVPKGTPGSKKYADGTYYKNGKETPINMIGALVCKLSDGKTFEIGTGFDHESRRKYWNSPPIGKIVTFKYQELSKDGIPRFPVFLRWREDL